MQCLCIGLFVLFWLSPQVLGRHLQGAGVAGQAAELQGRQLLCRQGNLRRGKGGDCWRSQEKAGWVLSLRQVLEALWGRWGGSGWADNSRTAVLHQQDSRISRSSTGVCGMREVMGWGKERIQDTGHLRALVVQVPT